MATTIALPAPCRLAAPTARGLRPAAASAKATGRTATWVREP